jgi:hypothetical protein
MALDAQDFQVMADRYRSYAVLCREFAITEAGAPLAASLLAQAEKWERDAEWAVRGGKAIASSRELLHQVTRILEREPPTK